MRQLPQQWLSQQQSPLQPTVIASTAIISTAITSTVIASTSIVSTVIASTVIASTAIISLNSDCLYSDRLNSNRLNSNCLNSDCLYSDCLNSDRLNSNHLTQQWLPLQWSPQQQSSQQQLPQQWSSQQQLPQQWLSPPRWGDRLNSDHLNSEHPPHQMRRLPQQQSPQQRSSQQQSHLQRLPLQWLSHPPDQAIVSTTIASIVIASTAAVQQTTQTRINEIELMCVVTIFNLPVLILTGRQSFMALFPSLDFFLCSTADTNLDSVHYRIFIIKYSGATYLTDACTAGLLSLPPSVHQRTGCFVSELLVRPDVMERLCSYCCQCWTMGCPSEGWDVVGYACRQSSVLKNALTLSVRKIIKLC